MPSRKETSLPTLIQALFFRGHMKLRGYDSSRYPPGASCAWFGLGQSNTPMDSLMKGPGMLWGEYHSNDEWQRSQKHQLTIARWHTVTMIHSKMTQMFSFKKPIYPLISTISGALCAKDSSSVGKYESSLAPKSLCPVQVVPLVFQPNLITCNGRLTRAKLTPSKGCQMDGSWGAQLSNPLRFKHHPFKGAGRYWYLDLPANF